MGQLAFNGTASLFDLAPSSQVSENKGLNGGPCRDRTYDQLIKSISVWMVLLSSKPITYVSASVPQFLDLGVGKLLNQRVLTPFNGTGAVGLIVDLQPPEQLQSHQISGAGSPFQKIHRRSSR